MQVPGMQLHIENMKEKTNLCPHWVCRLFSPLSPKLDNVTTIHTARLLGVIGHQAYLKSTGGWRQVLGVGVGEVEGGVRGARSMPWGC